MAHKNKKPHITTVQILVPCMFVHNRPDLFRFQILTVLHFNAGLSEQLLHICPIHMGTFPLLVMIKLDIVDDESNAAIFWAGFVDGHVDVIVESNRGGHFNDKGLRVRVYCDGDGQLALKISVELNAILLIAILIELIIIVGDKKQSSLIYTTILY